MVLHNGTVDSDPARVTPGALDPDFALFWEDETATQPTVLVKLDEDVEFSQTFSLSCECFDIPPPGCEKRGECLIIISTSPESGTTWTVDWQTSVLDELLRLKYEYREVLPKVDGVFQMEPFLAEGLVVSHIIINSSGVDWAGYTFRLKAADILVDCLAGIQVCEGRPFDLGSIIDESLDRPIALVGDLGYSGDLAVEG
ncbi:MAG: hypothetical protein V3W34_04110, partial [Phycisphaerae bacterium]